MKIGLRLFSASTVNWFINAVNEPGQTRCALARMLCDREGWVDRNGRPCLSSARKLLPRFATRLGIALPAAGPNPFAGAPRQRTGEVIDAPSLSGSLADLGTVTLQQLHEARDKRRWDTMMEQYHPQGWARPPGAQIRYWVHSSVHGIVGGLNFCAASWHQKARDAFIGWSAEARVAHLDKVINNQRFLILPSVRVPELASHVLGQAIRQVGEDWHAVYGVRPLMAYTYVDPAHKGTCYRAAGWQRCETPTAGQPPHRSAGTQRTVWMKPLTRNGSTGLQTVPPRPFGQTLASPLPPSADWATREYGRSHHPDGRTRNRLVRMGRAWLNRPGAPIQEIFPRPADHKAAIRLLSNASVTLDHILQPHVERTVERCRQETRRTPNSPIILALQDTTALNYRDHPKTKGPLSPGGGGKGTRGLLAHVGLIINEHGRPLGLFTLDTAFRDDPKDCRENKSRRWQRGLQRAGELADACPGTRIITVCGREGDFWDLLNQATTESRPLLVRASRSSRRRVQLDNDRTACLFEHLAHQPMHTTCFLPLTSRTVSLEIRATAVTVLPPRDTDSPTPITLQAVSATEQAPVHGKFPLHWLLLTTETEDPEMVLYWYQRRWAMDSYSRILKTGLRVEHHQFDDVNALHKCLAFDAITAVRVMDLERGERTQPETPTRCRPEFQTLEHPNHNSIRSNSMSIPSSSPRLYRWVESALTPFLLQVKVSLSEADASGPAGTMHRISGRFHHIQGLLEMAELDAASLLARDLAQLSGKMADRPLTMDFDEGVICLKRGLETLQEYQFSIENQSPRSPLVLVDEMNAIRQMSGGDSVCGYDLFHPPLDCDPKFPPRGQSELSSEDQSSLLANLRKGYRKALLSRLKHPEQDDSVTAMAQIMGHMQRVSRLETDQRFWWVAAGFMESLKGRRVDVVSGTNVLFARLDNEMSRMQDAPVYVDNTPTEELLREMLYFIGSAGARPCCSGQVGRIKTAFGLNQWFPEETGCSEPNRLEPLSGSMVEFSKKIEAGFFCELESRLDQYLSGKLDGESTRALCADLDTLDRLYRETGLGGAGRLIGALRSVIQDMNTDRAQLVQGGGDHRIASSVSLLKEALHDPGRVTVRWLASVAECESELYRLTVQDEKEGEAKGNRRDSTEYSRTRAALLNDIDAMLADSGTPREEHDLRQIEGHFNTMARWCGGINADRMAQLSENAAGVLSRIRTRGIGLDREKKEKIALVAVSIGLGSEPLEPVRSGAVAESARTMLESLVAGIDPLDACPETPVCVHDGEAGSAGSQWMIFPGNAKPCSPGLKPTFCNGEPMESLRKYWRISGASF